MTTGQMGRQATLLQRILFIAAERTEQSHPLQIGPLHVFFQAEVEISVQLCRCEFWRIFRAEDDGVDGPNQSNGTLEAVVLILQQADEGDDRHQLLFHSIALENDGQKRTGTILPT